MISKNIDSFKITVRNSQTVDGRVETIRETARCSYRRNRDSAYITYKTSDSLNMIKADDKTVTIRRSGDVSSVMRFESGKITETEYKTAYGVIPMSVRTSLLRCGFDDNGGVIRLKYELCVCGDKLYNDIGIEVER